MLLQTISVANWLQDKLNAISESQNADYKFKIFGDIGYNKASNEIKGVLKAIKGDIEPLKNDIDIEYAFVCELSVPSQNANFDIINVRKLIDTLIVQENATSDSLDDGDCLFTFSTTLPKDYKIEYGVGTITPLYFVVYVRYTQYAVTSANKHWFLNEFEIPFLTESVLLDKDGMLNKISGENYSKALITGQTKFYKFTFQYDTKNDLCIGLQKDILNGDFEKTYTLKYYDGVAYTEQEPFTATVSIYKNADSGVERTKTGMFNVTFVDADNGDNQTKYYLALIDTPFDMSGENTRNFIATADKTAKQVQIEYFESQVLNGAGYEQIKAPNLNSIDITSQIYRNTNNYDLFDLVNKNYAIIKIEKNGTATRYYYYFVTNASIGAGNQVVYDLKLDTLQTYFFDDNINFADCMIEKAHLNRFVQDRTDSTRITFNAFNTSQLFENEEFGDAPKRLVKRTKINLLPSDFDSTINEFLKENVAYWVYITIDKNQEAYKVIKSTLEFLPTITTDFSGEFATNTYSINDSGTSIYTDETSILFFPVMKTTKKIYAKKYSNDYKIEICNYGLDGFRNLNKNSSYFYNIKFSIYPPISLFSDNFTGAYEFDEDGNLIFVGAEVDQAENFITLRAINTKAIITNFDDISNDIYGLFAGLMQNRKYLKTEDYSVDERISFLKSDIVGANKNIEFNPKMLSENFKTITICDGAGGRFNYDLQKINRETFNFLYTETIQPEVTKYYFRLNGIDTISIFDNGMLYNAKMNNSYLGLVGSVDNSVALSNDQYSSFLANNKNFWLQSNFKIVEGTLMGAFGGAMADKTKGMIGAMVGAGAGAITSTVDRNLTIDNMRNAPSSLSNANGNALFNMFVTEMGLYIEEYDALSNEKEMANDTMFKYGFTVNKIGKISNFINIRKYFNYIRAKLDAISGVAMSNTARTDLSTRFANGVRFWNSDDIQYEKENYENWLEN